MATDERDSLKQIEQHLRTLNWLVMALVIIGLLLLPSGKTLALMWSVVAVVYTFWSGYRGR